MPTLVLAILYLIVTVYGCRQITYLHRISPELNTKKLFVMNCLLASFLRFLCFSTLTVFGYFEYNLYIRTNGAGNDDTATSTIEIFYEKASIVMLDLPDFCFMSAYVLLLIVWAESILLTRRHWYEMNIIHGLISNLWLYVSKYLLLGCRHLHFVVYGCWDT